MTSKKILIIEDEVAIADLEKDYLENMKAMRLRLKIMVVLVLKKQLQKIMI